MYIGRVRNALQAIFYPTNLINGGASFRWSFGLLFAWGSIESTTFRIKIVVEKGVIFRAGNARKGKL